MLSGVKFISREEIDKGKNEKKSGEKVKGKRNKWYSSEEYSSGSESGSEDSLDQNKKKRQSGKKKKSKSSRKHCSSDDSSSSSDDGRKERSRKGSKKGGRKKDATRSDLSDDDKGDDMTIRRKEMGLDWMLRPKEPIHTDGTPASMAVEDQPEEALTEEIKKPNPRELNPYLKDNGSGYPEEADEARTDGSHRVAPSVIGDGGASWRLKALKRAQEQAAREGRKLNEVVEERWGSVGQLAVSAASRSAAPSRAHLHAIRSRQKDVDKKSDKEIEKNIDRDYLKDVSLRPHDMKAPKVHNNLSWGKRKLPSKEAGVISAAMATLNKFSNDGSFLHELQKQSDGVDNVGYTKSEDKLESGLVSVESDKPIEENAFIKEGLSANQLAAKALQLRMKGKLEEAEKLMQEADRIKAMQQENTVRPRNEGSTNRLLMKDMSSREKKKEDDADIHLARKIMQNKQYSMSGRADDEYDFEDGPSRKSRKKGGGDDRKVSQRSSLATHILTQQERCLFCFENPNRPKHLVVSIANFTYLMLPQWQSVVPGHCCILTTQHESSTRTVDNNVWDEIRNFKKCLIMMFAKQDKELVFLETVMGLAQQRRHCMVECIPLPQDIAKEAPLYFKKAIDEAEDEWSQHNAKKLIDTSVKGLRGSIPKDFPYFHVEFGLSKGFVHVIDDEQQFKSNLGLNVIRGMLQLAEEDMYRRRRHESVETQKLAVSSFIRDWEPFDWTKQLE